MRMKKTDKRIVTCAVTGAVHMPCMSPHLPITPEQIIDEAVAAAEAGAAIIHLHARDPQTGQPTTDTEVYRRFLPEIKRQCDAIINITTGQPRLDLSPEAAFEARMQAPREFQPEICSFNMGPGNFGLFSLKERLKDKIIHDWERVFFEESKGFTFTNSFEMMERMGKELGETRGVRFEFECYDLSHLHALKFILDQGWVQPPLFIQTIYGFIGALPADPKYISLMKQTADELFGDNYHWSNLAAGKDQMGMVTVGAVMGSHVRVGLEDSLWYGRGELASSNAQQVERICRVLEELSIEIATADEARLILGTKGKDNVNF